MTEYQYGVRIAWGDGSTTVEWSSHARALVDLHMSAEADAMPGVGVAGRELVRRVVVPGEVEVVPCDYAERRAAAEAGLTRPTPTPSVALAGLDEETANTVYDVLVGAAIADEGWRGDFVFRMVRGQAQSYCVFGGPGDPWRVWLRRDDLTVTVYPSGVEVPGVVLAGIEAANAGLAALRTTTEAPPCQT